MKFLKLTVFCFTTWVLAALQTAVMSGLYLRWDGSLWLNEGETFVLVILCLIFSIPAIMIYWIYFIICACTEELGGQKLFRRMMAMNFYLSAISGAICYYSLRKELGHYPWIIIPIVVLAAMTTVFIHRPAFVAGFKAKENEQTVSPVQ